MKKLKSSFEGNIVEYYDDFFLDKEKVETETEFISKMLLQEPQICRILDIGCGTGYHDEILSRRFEHIDGVDISSDMVKYARKNHSTSNNAFEIADIRKWDEISEKYDAVISLSHVIGYQTDNASFDDYLKNINRKLRVGGVFLYNFYNAPALFFNALKPRHVKKSVKNHEISRISNATLNPDSNCLNLDYYYIIQTEDVSDSFEIHENMRYFTMMELEYAMKKNGFENIRFFKWMDKKKLSGDDWNGGCIARKITLAD
ncbi:MAG: class I SAM-dependent methyltransferase [Roseburia sp.]|jgi:SAM-dependent methyltransferase|nr:class I SAM-dependent methyltransferase [Roseburia sp.]